MQWPREEVSVAWIVVDGLDQQVRGQTDVLSSKLEIARR